MGARMIDGPAAGLNIDSRRAPRYLRVVCGGSKGKVHAGQRFDILDQPDDEPERGEAVLPYRMVQGTLSVVYVRPGVRFESGDYLHCGDVGDDLLLAFRVRDQFIAWAVMDHFRRTLPDAGRAPARVLADVAGIDEHRFRAGALEVGAITDGSDVWGLPDDA